MSTLWKRVAALFHRRRLDGDLEEEIAAHLAMQEEEFRARGMSPGDARLAARREFGGVAQTMETYRERRGVAWLENALKDLRYGLRGLARNPGFTAAAVLSLALGIGANTAIFSLLRSLMFRTLPVSHPEELVYLYRTGGWGRGYISYPLYLDLAKRSDVFRGVAARTGNWRQRFSRAGSSAMDFAQVEYVSGNYFSLLGVAPAAGRLIGEDDNRLPHGQPVAVLSYEFWRNRFGSASALGATVTLNELPFTVIGVASPGFRGVEVEHHPDLWVPCTRETGKILDAGRHWVWALGRRQPATSLARMQSVVDAVMRQHLTERYGKNNDAAFRKTAFDQRLEVFDAAAGISSLRFLFGKALLVLMAAVGLVLLAACANLAHLLLARGAARQREIALRFSLGATRGRLIRQALTETLLLSVFGSVLGLLFAWWGQQAILGFLPLDASDPLVLTPDAAVLAFTAGVSLLAAVLFGLAPAWRSTALDPAAGLRGESARAVRRHGLRSALVIAQVALSVVLVALAGVFGGTLYRLRAIDVGFRNRSVLAFQLDWPGGWDAARKRQFRDDFVDRASRLPGVQSVSYGFPGPFAMGMANASIRVPGSTATAAGTAEVAIASIAPRYFETIGARLIAGREFDARDTAASQSVAIVDESFVRRFLPGIDNPIGRALSFDDSKPEGGARTYIVGVVRDVRHEGLREPSKPTVYSPVTQPIAMGGYWVLVNGHAPARDVIQVLRREISNLSGEVVLTEPTTMARQIDDSIFQERILACLSGFFGVLALLLAAVGLYGVVAYRTAQRAREIGLRIALGARRGGVLWMVMRDALLLVMGGLVAGVPTAALALRAVRSILEGVPPAGQAVFVYTSAALLAAGLAAALGPAWRAATLDPIATLRQD